MYVPVQEGRFEKVPERRSSRTQLRGDIDWSGERLDTVTIG